MNEKLDWIEDHAIKSLLSRHENADYIARETNYVLTLLLAGGGACLGFSAVHADGEKALLAAALVTAIWLFALGAALLIRVKNTKDFPSVYNSPKNLLSRKDLSFDDLKLADILRIQDSIDQAAAIVFDRSLILNSIQRYSCATPIVSIVSYTIAWAITAFA